MTRAPITLAAALAVGLLWTSGAWAGSASSDTAPPKDPDMSAGEAVDNLVEDSKKTGDAVVEAGSDAGDAIVEGAKDAADWTEEKYEQATE